MADGNTTKPGDVFAGVNDNVDKNIPVKNTKDPMDQYQQEAGKLPGVLSGVLSATKDWDTTGSAFSEINKTRGDLQTQSASSFDPIISHDWTAPGYHEDKENVEALKADMKNKEEALRQRRLEAKKKAKKTHDEEYKALKEEIYNKARERNEKRAEEKKNKAIKSQEERFQKSVAKDMSNPAYKWFAENTERRPKDKDIDYNTEPDYLDLTTDERKTLREKQSELLSRQKKAIDEFESAPETKGMRDELETAKNAYRLARKELTKKQAPYAIRNAFLIIDVIQKSLQNIGRALPKSQYSPAYTQTPFEEPQLFKLWREQIEKGQERQLKAEEAIPDVVGGNIRAKNKLPEDINKTLIERKFKWDDLVKELRLGGLEKQIKLDQQKELEEYAAEGMSEESLKNAALFAAYKEAGNGELMKAHRDKWVAENVDNVRSLSAWLASAGITKNMVTSVLTEVGKDIAVVASVTGKTVVNSIAAALNELPDFSKMTDAEVERWLYYLSSMAGDVKNFWNNLINGAFKTNDLLKIGKDLDNKQKELDKLIEKKNKALEEADKAKVEWEKQDNVKTYSKYDKAKKHAASFDDDIEKLGNDITDLANKYQDMLGISGNGGV